MSEFRVADANAVYRGVPLETLMENAGKAVARESRKLMKGDHARIVAFCGKGNNGGDGCVAARELASRSRVTVVLAEGKAAVDPRGPAAGPLKQILSDRSIRTVEWGAQTRGEVERAAAGADLVLDCLLGTGIAGPARTPYRELIAFINRLEGPVLSVDVPSGFPFEPAVRPQVTVTLEAPKVGMSRRGCGRIVAVPIGFPPEAWTHTGPGELTLIPRVSDHATKRDRGVLALVGGGPYSGAPALAALAAYACGVGLVHIFVPENVADVVRHYDPTLIVHPLPGSALGARGAEQVVGQAAAFGCGALAVGPGLGRAPATLEATRRIIRDVPLPAVVDADAIRAARGLKPGALSRALVTPHDGEFRALTGRAPGAPEATAQRQAAARRAAAEFKTTVLLKGHTTVITDGRRVKLNDTGVSAMAVGGTGDVLTGVTGALLSKGLSPFDAGRAGAFLLGRAGQIAFEELGHSLKPSDLLPALPRALARDVPWWGGKP